MKVLSPRAHAPIDYLMVAVFGLSPMVLGFSGIAATLCYAFGIAVLGMSLMTAYPQHFERDGLAGRAIVPALHRARPASAREGLDREAIPEEVAGSHAVP